MKKSLLLLSLILILFSCSSETSETIDKGEIQSFDVQLDATTLNPEVDELVTIQVQSDQPLKEFSWISENVVRTHSGMGSDLDPDFPLYFQFASTGPKEVNLSFTSTSNKVTTKKLNFDVKKGNTVQIIGFRINSFWKIGDSWDPEFSEDNEERLADIALGFSKLMLFNFTQTEKSFGVWYISPVHNNESSLEWDLESENLHLNPDRPLGFGISDDDGGNISQNLLIDRIYLDVDLSQYKEAQPSSIDFSNAEEEIDITIFLNW